MSDRYSIPARAGIAFFITASRSALQSTQPLIQRELAAMSPGVKQPEREAVYCPPPSALETHGTLPPVCHTSS